MDKYRKNPFQSKDVGEMELQKKEEYPAKENLIRGVRTKKPQSISTWAFSSQPLAGC
jgi:hypothetical protein